MYFKNKAERLFSIIKHEDTNLPIEMQSNIVTN